MSKVTVLGSFVVDLMARSPHFPSPAETVKGSMFKMGPGGKGFNQAVAAFKAGADINLVTKLGRDTFGTVATNTMDELGISKEHLLFSEKVETGAAVILVDECSGQNEIIIVPGACSTITDEEIDALENIIADSEYVLLQLEVNQSANERIVEIAEKYNCKVIVNTAPYSPISDTFLSKCFMVTPNEVEAEGITGIKVTDFDSAKSAADVFHAKGVKNVIITLGSVGCFVSSEGTQKIIPAFKVNALDTTGAGDAFTGGLVAAMSEGKNIWDAVTFASALAALSVQKIGTTPSMPWKSEIEEFLQNLSR